MKNYGPKMRYCGHKNFRLDPQDWNDKCGSDTMTEEIYFLLAEHCMLDILFIEKILQLIPLYECLRGEDKQLENSESI